MRVDLIIQPHLPADEFAALGELAESYGISGVWVSNHLDGRDPFVNFVPLAQRTQKLQHGPDGAEPVRRASDADGQVADDAERYSRTAARMSRSAAVAVRSIRWAASRTAWCAPCANASKYYAWRPQASVFSTMARYSRCTGSIRVGPRPRRRRSMPRRAVSKCFACPRVMPMAS